MDTIETSLTDVEDTIDITIADDSMNMHKLLGLDLDVSSSLLAEDINILNENAVNEIEEEIATPVKNANCHANEKVDSSVETTETETSLFHSFTEGAGLLLSGNTTSITSNINQPPSNNSSMDQEPQSQSASTSMLSNDIFLDAFDQLTDLAMAVGIVSPQSQPQPDPKNCIDNDDDDDKRFSPPRDNRMKPKHSSLRVKPKHSSLDMEIGPGQISSAAKSYNDDQPFDEMDEAESAHSSLMKKGEMSAMARMRYIKTTGIDPFDTPQVFQSTSASASTKSYQEIQKEKHEKWSRLKAQATREEAEYMQMQTPHEEPDKHNHDDNDDNDNSLAELESKYADDSPQREGRRRGGSEEKENGNGKGFFDLSMLKGPLESVHAAILGAVMGGDSDDEYSCASSYYDDGDDIDDDDESYYSRNESKGDKRSTGRSQSTKKKSKDIPPTRGGRKSDWDGDGSDDDEEELDFQPVVEKSVGFSKSFLEDITGHGIELDWHRPRLNPASRLVSKVRVHIQISDTKDSDGCEEPNLIWEVMEDERASRRTMIQVVRREKLSLFDISTIERATELLEMKAFPHADPDTSILITLNDSSCFLFEAPDGDTARRVMHGLRWVEARMAFNIIVGNMHICSEMLSTNEHFGGDLTAELFQTVTNQLVEKTANSIM